jgi:N-methylhydantoinase B
VVAAVGGIERIAPGDVIWSTSGYDIGSHPQDAVIVVPAFLRDKLLGFSVVKAHHEDIGANDFYCTDTTDNFQEGVIFPGVKLYRQGELQRDMYRTILANSRTPKSLAGDLNAQVGAARLGVSLFTALVEKYGKPAFRQAVARAFDHGEETVRRFIESIPDGRYEATGVVDNNGVDDCKVPFRVTVEISGSDALVDFGDGPPEQRGPINSPLPATVATGRLAIITMMGGADLPNEGHFRPIAVRAKHGTMWHPRPPAPIFLYAWGADHVIEAIHREMSAVLPTRVAASSGGDLGGAGFTGVDEDGKLWNGGTDDFTGQGATSDGDGGSPLMVLSCSGIRNTPIEVLEAKFPLLVERWELAADSGGAGRFRGGLGFDVDTRVLADCRLISTFERTKTPPWGLLGGKAGRPNSICARFPDGSVKHFSKVTGLFLPRGSVVERHIGGGGGYGNPCDRDREAVERDLAEGYVTLNAARGDYSHAFVKEAAADRASRSEPSLLRAHALQREAKS